MSKTLISAIILSGGRATRLDGQDKGLCLYKNKPLISHVVDLLKPQVSEIIISANRNLENYKTYSEKVVSDGNSGFEGPLKGISAALPHCSNDWILVVTCDLPLLPTNLINNFDLNSQSEVQIISVNERLQLCFLMKKSLQTNLNEYLDGGGVRVMEWVKTCQHQIFPYQGKELDFKNFNRAQDFLD